MIERNAEPEDQPAVAEEVPAEEDWSEFLAPPVVVEAVILDTDQDAVADTVLMDTDQDAVVDTVLMDTDEDAVADTVLMDTDADGVLDTAVVDLDPSGGLPPIVPEPPLDTPEPFAQEGTDVMGDTTEEELELAGNSPEAGEAFDMAMEEEMDSMDTEFGMDLS